MMSGESEDPLQAALNEAQQVLDDIDIVGGGTDMAGFSIDSDEEDDDDDSRPPLAIRTPDKKEGDNDNNNDDIHPLSDEFLTAPSPAAMMSHPLNNNNNNGVASPHQAQQQQQPPAHVLQPPAGTATASTASTAAATVGSGGATPLRASPTADMLNPLSASAAAAAAASGGASLDVFKQQTSRFASNLASMAQRAANQVATAASTTPTAVGGASATPNMMFPQPVVAVASPSPYLLQQPVPQQPQSPQSPQQQQLANTELDSEQKAALIQTHVGELLPGERVIMFLSNLLHVSDSTGFSYSHQTQPNVLWCCAMTYYRLLLFSTHPVGSPLPMPRPSDWNASCWPSRSVHLLQMPLASMDRVEKSVFSSNNGLTNATTLMGLTITGKDNQRQVRFTTPSYADTVRAHEALMNYAFPGRRNLGYLFAFESKKERVMASIQTDASTGQKRVTLPADRQRFDAVAEFSRQFGNNTGKNSNLQQQQQRPWTIYQQTNSPNYQLCQSYPSIIAGPASLDESKPEHARILQQSAQFRSEGRLPALTWASSCNGGSLWRASQPKVGLQGNRSLADELLLKHVREQAAAANALSAQDNNNNNGTSSQLVLSRQVLQQLTGSPDVHNWLPSNAGVVGGPAAAAGVGNELKILDLRPRSSALGNRTGGYGYENTSNYTGSTLQFCNIPNIHAVRDAYQKMSAVCTSPNTQDTQFAALIEDTKWLAQVRLILAASWEAAFWIHVHHLPVLLHCSHGWDRTSQVAVLCQLLLDPYYRTRQGFACLVEKDFMSFGHPFHLRCAHGERRAGTENDMMMSSSTSTPSGGVGSMSMNAAANLGNVSADEGQRSPIFIQFLDCVYQIVAQYPECFEFNTKYLLLMSEHVYSCRFGNFLCDTEREREQLAGLRQRTHSIWDFLEERTDTLNPSFCHERNSGVLLMPLPTLLRSVTLWTDRHARHGSKATVRWMPPELQESVSAASPTKPSLRHSASGGAIGLTSGGGGIDHDDDHGGSHARTTVQENQHLLARLESATASSTSSLENINISQHVIMDEDEDDDNNYNNNIDKEAAPPPIVVDNSSISKPEENGFSKSTSSQETEPSTSTEAAAPTDPSPAAAAAAASEVAPADPLGAATTSEAN